MLTTEQVNRYLNRIGVKQSEDPSIEYLRELHKAHIERLSWQTIDIFYGKPRPIDYETSVNLMLTGRSGYCFHLNGAFSRLLISLGFSVRLHRAGVQTRGAEPLIDSYHLGLTVEINEEEWIVDVGLGDMPFEPLPLVSGTYPQGPLVYKVQRSSVSNDGWRMEHDPLATFMGVDIERIELEDISEFLPKHQELSTLPDSPWVNLLLVRNRDADGTNELKGCIYTRRDNLGSHKMLVDNKAQWFEVLSDVFGECLPDYSTQDRNVLWNKTLRKHEEWDISDHKQS